MKTKILTLKQKSGLLSPLQSDTIYGHFCWRMAESFGGERLTEFIELYRNGNPVFLLSDGLIKSGGEIHFPKPLIQPVSSSQKKTKADKIRSFVGVKTLKEKKHFTLEELNNFLAGRKTDTMFSAQEAAEKTKKKKTAVQSSLRVNVQIDRNTLSSSEGQLFSYSPEYTAADTERVIFIRVADETGYTVFNCEELLKEVFLIGFGKKKSSGYGQFDVVSFEEYSDFNEPETCNAFVVLGNYIPSARDGVTPLAYNYDVKYGKLGEHLSLGDNPFKNPVVLFGAGSCFSFAENSSRNLFIAGKVTEPGEMSEAFPQAVQFGMPFILPFTSTD